MWRSTRNCMTALPGVSRGSGTTGKGGGGSRGKNRIFRPTGHVLALYRRSGWTILDEKWNGHVV